jgi:hypothetical protein
MSSTGNSIININDVTLVNFDSLLKKITFRFVSSEFAATMKEEPEQSERIFILEKEKNKADYHRRFDNGEDLIFQLADEIYRCYTKEARECLQSGDSFIAKRKEEIAKNIHGELKKVYKSVSKGDVTIKESINTNTIVVWLTPNLKDSVEPKKLELILHDVISSILIFKNQSDFLSFLQKREYDAVVFLIITTDYNNFDYQQVSNVKYIYRYEKPSSKKEAIIDNYNDLRSRLIRDLIAHYDQLGSNCSTRRDAQAAEIIFKKIRKLYNIIEGF